MARRAQPADARLDLALLPVQDLEVRHLEDSRDDLRVRGLGLQSVHVGAALRPAGESLRVVEVKVSEDHVLDVTRIHAQLLQGADHWSALQDQAGVDEVVALAADEQRVRKGDHASGAPALLKLLVAPEAVGRVVDRRYVGVTVGDSEDVPLRGYENVDAGQLLGGGGFGSRRRLRRVLELLLGAEQLVEDGLAQVLVQRDREDGPHDPDDEQLAERMALLALALEAFGGLLQVLGSRAEVALDLLVVGERLDRALAVRHALIGVTGRIESVPDARPQLFVLDEPAYVRVGTRLLRRLARLLSPRTCHQQLPRPLGYFRGAYTRKSTR